MGCSVMGCQEGNELKTEPCTVCGKHVHHMCSIGVYEGAQSALNERFCSQACVQVVYPSTNTAASLALVPEKRAASSSASTNIWVGSDSDFIPSPDLPLDTDVEPALKRRKPTTKTTSTGITTTRNASTGKKKATSVKTTKKALSQSKARVADRLETPSPVPAPPVSELGIPLSVKHSRRPRCPDDVWDLIHTLEVPYKKQNPWKPSAVTYRDICLLCCQEIKSRARTNMYSWEEALCNKKHASNAKDHIKLIHADHPLAVLAEQSSNDKAKTDVQSAETEAHTVLDLTRETAIVPSAEATTSSPTGKRFFRANEKTLNVLISKFLVSQGLPYTLCASEPFKDVIRAATGDPSFPILGRDKHDRLLNGQFQLFCELVGDLLSSEFTNACQMKFLNLMHDIWTSCGKESIVGASVAFIDSSWRFRFIAVLACVKNDGHDASSVAKVIENSLQTRYNVDIRRMTRFTMSNTTPSAKNVADYIDTEQESCSMHLLNLCIGYGIGLKDNIQTVTVWNDSTTSWDKVVKIVTPGGALEEGGNVIRKLRNLNNHFRSAKQRAALKKIQEALSYPELEPMTDQDVRVAYTCKLIRRSVVNYAAFQAFFQSGKDTSTVWTALTADDWKLAVEMEAVTNFIANLALVEAQNENLVSSYMVVFRRLAEKKLKAFKFDGMALEAPGAKDANEVSHRRVVKTHDQFSDAGKRCLTRTLLQLQARFPKVTKEAMACVLLDPRTKSSAKKNAAVGDIPRKEEKAIYKNGIDFLREEHRQVFTQLAKSGKISLSQQSSQSTLLSQESISPFSSPASAGWDDEDELLLGAPIRASKTRDEVKETELNARADAVMMEWMDLEPEWLEVAQHQNPDISKEELSKEMSIDSHDGMYWALLGIYKYIDVLRWFNEVGEQQFPSIALLARIHLGKISSSAYQERVFSTGGIVMGPLRTRTDGRRAERQLLLRHNRDELVKLKQDARKANSQK